MTDQATFELGPPDPVSDSRRLPVITSDDEAGFVSGADLGKDHPDNVDPPADLPGEGDAPADDAPEPLPSEDELDSMVAALDVNAVDTTGFDASDLGFVGLDGPDPAPRQEAEVDG